MFKFFATKEWYKRTAASAEGCDVSAGKPVGLEPANPTPPEEPTTNEDGSLFKVPLTAIVNVEPHTNADRLELATVYGFQVIVQKGKYKPGNKIIYIPIDSLLPIWLETILFPEGSKITLHHHRVRQIRIRKLASQGMLVDPSDVVSKVNTDYLALEQDLAAILNIAKYEPPTPKFQQSTGPKPRDKKNCNPYFRTYNGINNLKWLPNLFKEGEDVVIQCKLHGSHIRWAKAPFSANTLWKKVLKFFNFTPKFECVYGSNRVELTNKRNYKGFYGEDVYGAVLSKLNVFDKIKDGEFWHAELIGPNIQKDYAYGHKEHHIVVFDIRIMQPDGTQKWLNPEEAESLSKERGFDFVPVLYKGPYSNGIVEHCTSGPSVYCPSEKIREGCVIKSRYGYDMAGSKRALKSINPDYLDGDHGDNH